MFVLALAACGGSEAPVTEAPPQPAATASARATAAQSAAPVEQKPARSNVDFIFGKPSPQPKHLPIVSIDGPGYDQTIPTANAKTYKVLYKVRNFGAQPEGSYLQFVLDNHAAAPVTDPKQKVHLTDLTPDGKPPAGGEHVVALYVARKNHESVKGDRAIAVRRFYVGRKQPSKWNWSREPFFLLGRPYGNYSGEAAQQILIDFYLVNVALSDKGYSVRMTLEGPGLGDEGKQRYITEWKPFLVWAPGNGEYTIEAALLDADAKVVEVPWSPTVRKFTVSESLNP